VLRGHGDAIDELHDDRLADVQAERRSLAVKVPTVDWFRCSVCMPPWSSNHSVMSFVKTVLPATGKAQCRCPRTGLGT
jgi:hypothetical protein